MLSASAVSGNNSRQGLLQPPNSQPSSPDAIAALLWEPFLVRRLLPKAAESRQVSSWAQLALLPSLRINIAAELGTRQRKMAVLWAQSVPNQGGDLARQPLLHQHHLNPLFSPFCLSSGKIIGSHAIGRVWPVPVSRKGRQGKFGAEFLVVKGAGVSLSSLL